MNFSKKHFTRNQINEFIKNRKVNSEKYQDLEVKDGELYRDGKQIIPIEDMFDLLYRLYNDPETGLKSSLKLFKYIKERFQGILRADVELFISTLQTDQVQKTRRKKQSQPANHY